MYGYIIIISIFLVVQGTLYLSDILGWPFLWTSPVIQ